MAARSRGVGGLAEAPRVGGAADPVRRAGPGAARRPGGALPRAARVLAALALAAAAPACAPTVPLSEHQALKTRFDALETRVDKISGENERLKMMVATQRQIIRDLRCLKSVDIEPAPEPTQPPQP